MDFADYLRVKKIDPHLFQTAEPDRYAEWEKLFAQVSAESFTAQKKFLINDTRRLYRIH